MLGLCGIIMGHRLRKYSKKIKKAIITLKDHSAKNEMKTLHKLSEYIILSKFILNEIASTSKF